MTTRKTLDGKSYAGDPHIIKPNWRFAPKTATAAASPTARLKEGKRRIEKVTPL